MWRKWCKVLIYVLFYMSSTKNCHLSIAILTWFVAKTKMATIFGDVTGLQQHHPLWNIPHLVLNIKGFPLKAKSFLNTATYQNLCGGVPSTSGLSLVYTTLGVWICEYVRGLSKKGNVQESRWQALSIFTSSCLNLLWFMTTKPSLKYAEQV